MFLNILVPVDFSDKNKQALDIAFELAVQSEGRVRLLHVIEIIADATFNEFEDFYMKLEERARQKMDALITPYQNGDARFEERIVYGSRTQAILDFATDYGIDLIVMSSHQVDPEDPATDWGTISYKVGILAACPIMLVK